MANDHSGPDQAEDGRDDGISGHAAKPHEPQHAAADQAGSEQRFGVSENPAQPARSHAARSAPAGSEPAPSDAAPPSAAPADAERPSAPSDSTAPNPVQSDATQTLSYPAPSYPAPPAGGQYGGGSDPFGAATVQLPMPEQPGARPTTASDGRVRQAYGAPDGWPAPPPGARATDGSTPPPLGPTGSYGPAYPGGPPHLVPGFGMPYPGDPRAAGYAQPAPPAGRAATRTGTVLLGLVAALVAGLVGGVIGQSVTQNGRGGSIGVLGAPIPDIDAATAPTTPVEAVAARVLPSVVQLRVEGAGESGEGSAMVLSADGLLLTNNHVVEAAATDGAVTAVFQDGSTAGARIIGRDPSSDLAVLRADGSSGLVPIELGNSDSVRVGQQVVAFGAPLGLGGTVTTGIISAVDRAVNVGEETGANIPTVLNALQTDAAINPGNSGGPLVDMDGRVVGINSAIATTGAQGGSIGVGFSIPINQARRVAEELERTGRASRAVLGVTVADDPRQAGAVIRGVTPGGAAELAGIRAGDIVLRFGDQRISTGTDLQAAVGSRAPGEVVEVQLADRAVRATLTAAPN